MYLITNTYVMQAIIIYTIEKCPYVATGEIYFNFIIVIWFMSVIWDREYRDQRLEADTIAHVAWHLRGRRARG